MKKLLLALVFVLAACAHTPKTYYFSHDEVSNEMWGAKGDSASKVYMTQLDIMEKMVQDWPKVEVDVKWWPCGEENSYYFFKAQLIVLCTEMSDYPGAAVFFAAHEMGHAIGHQYTDTSEEIDADELAALAMIKHGYLQELFDAAEYHANDPIQGHIPGDTHPSNGFRAWYLSCLLEGALTKRGVCSALYQGVQLKWETRLNDKVEDL